MKTRAAALAALGSLCVALGLSVPITHSQTKPATGTVQVHMVITDQTVSDNNEVPILRAENLQVSQGKNIPKVESIIPARGDNAALQLFLLIDDTCDASIGNNLNDLRDFIKAQPASTMVGIAYNATVQVAQNLTTDHALAAKAVRLPRGTLSSMDSPYLSLISLVKSWPQQKVRREVLMVSDGIDRLRGRTSTGPSSRTMPTLSIDADSASNASQRYGVIVHGLYSPGVGRLGRNAWEAQLGQRSLMKRAESTLRSGRKRRSASSPIWIAYRGF